MIRAATEADYEDLVDLARAFAAETGRAVTFSESRARTTIWKLIHSNEIDVVVAIEDEVLAGATSIAYECQYTNELLAYIDKFYIHEEFRGLGTSEALLQGVLKTCTARNAVMVFASATADMGGQNERAFVCLFAAHGFDVVGRIISKELT